MTTYDVDYFIAKFEAIPEEKWKDGDIERDGNGACCVLGHCGLDRIKHDYATPTEEAVELGKILLTHERVGAHLRPEYYEGLERKIAACWRINDECGRYSHGFAGHTPKQRILEALRDIKAKQGAPV